MDQASCAEDKEKMQNCGIMQSLDAMRSYSLWASSLANSTEKFFIEQRKHFHLHMQYLKDQIKDFDN